jgi:hypothetical protein
VTRPYLDKAVGNRRIGRRTRKSPLDTDSEAFAKLEGNVKLGALRYLMKAHLGKEVFDSRDADRFGQNGRICVIFL